MEKTTSFKVFYDADDKELAEHAIDAEVLGKSILSMANLISKADDLLNEGNKSVKVLVTSPAEKGSLGIAYTVVQLLPQAVDVLQTIGIVGAVGAAAHASALSLIRQLGSKKVISITRRQGSDKAVLELEDGEIECPAAVATLVTEPVIRDALISVVQTPLEGKDSPVFKIVDDNDQIVLKLEDEQTEEIKPLPRGTLLTKTVETKEVNVKFTQVNFHNEKGWRMDYNNEEPSVLLTDYEFLAKVRQAEGTITSEDMFSVLLETTKTVSARGRSEKYVIKKVLRHRVAQGKKLI
ncbi:hypothetical protein ACR90R_23820 [Klebsiella pneumoniae]|jgi:hypothetical protein|uniref:hypothetical protein n=1 Tax=Klebsiella pneumoniae complex TaxID=3390273 RepID=UPI000C7DB9F7|nr:MULTISPECIES: hypothetical protein [Klebsiella]DAT62731.1 MAG TPA: hypothetical protein [Caudoviricetes sp.]HCD1310656.1 hypothetical protein [Klebsiella pneumoniae subsp. pneumoniae]HCI6537797.1 hypothetical protein [Klebsiella variicola subsp. variicola]HDG8060310.1 hypothetical protein [Klebsiella quasipneumoniae subsp. similipneumoniae]MBC5246987.1 hypothetical protein [Klebsiella pneumoniae]